MIRIDFVGNFNKMERFMSEAKTSVLRNATRRSINRTGDYLQTVANEQVRQKRKLKAKEIKTRFFKLTKSLKGSDITKYEAKLGIKYESISLRHFLKGSKTPKSQAGIKAGSSKRYPGRRRIKVEIQPGKTESRDDIFLAKAKGWQGSGESYQLFRRRKEGDKGNQRIIKQVTPSLHYLFEDPEFRNKIDSKVGNKLQIEFMSAFKYFLERKKTA